MIFLEARTIIIGEALSNSKVAGHLSSIEANRSMKALPKY